MNKKKKTISINNPAIELIQRMQEIDQGKQEIDLSVEAANDAKPKPKIRPAKQAYTKRALQGREAKSKRLNILIRPSLHEALLQLSDQEMISINELINLGMREYIDKHLSDHALR